MNLTAMAATVPIVVVVADAQLVKLKIAMAIAVQIIGLPMAIATMARIRGTVFLST
jgi:uncharacterized membrane protein YccF (DUF307 family)